MAQGGKVDCKTNESMRKSGIVLLIELGSEDCIRQEVRPASAVRRPFDDDVSNRASARISTIRGGMGRNTVQGGDAHQK